MWTLGMATALTAIVFWTTFKITRLATRSFYPVTAMRTGFLTLFVSNLRGSRGFRRLLMDTVQDPNDTAQYVEYHTQSCSLTYYHLHSYNPITGDGSLAVEFAGVRISAHINCWTASDIVFPSSDRSDFRLGLWQSHRSPSCRCHLQHYCR